MDDYNTWLRDNYQLLGLNGLSKWEFSGACPVRSCMRMDECIGRRLALLRDVHDGVGHKGVWSTRAQLLVRFWWPSLDTDVRWFICTCHDCQTGQLTQLRIPPTVAIPLGLFRKAYIDTMLMPKIAGFCYIVQARCGEFEPPEVVLTPT